MLFTNCGENRKMSSGLSVTLALLNKRYNARTQVDRMQLAHGRSPSLNQVNHKPAALKISNPVNSNPFYPTFMPTE